MKKAQSHVSNTWFSFLLVFGLHALLQPRADSPHDPASALLSPVILPFSKAWYTAGAMLAFYIFILTIIL
jgi:hypothetical protein